ncbi:hypothetical protein SYK_04970 [Pseudodesulfovibrio nedwellii]|uniref:Uncharacterized protein n=1 Tax=Pseudodesulfovibrio nedwellii TaxID=2973072 RepID=A0ABM8AXU8_9BACT|nr:MULTISPECIES: hypothetical protein [Pseudodesulfovibrio]BDQ36137.1 hypothetical protein SYK_04970 [Pseudodesulfovibrio nedwellii]
MSDISISTDTVQSIAMDNMLSGPESVGEESSIIASGMNARGVDSMEQAVAGLEVASRTEEFFGAGTDFSSTGTDVDIQQAISSTLDTGIGSITDKIA